MAMLSILDVAGRFRPRFPFPYPGHQRGPLVEEFVHRELARRVAAGDDGGLTRPWTYVPVYWTSYAVQVSSRGRWARKFAWQQLHWHLRRRMQPGVNYFTVSQHDDGLAQRGTFRPPRPILEFSAGGTGDIPLPLLCDPHPVTPRPRDVRASFVGAVTNPTCDYPCRTAMVQALAGHSQYLIVDVQTPWGETDREAQVRRQREFVDLMSRSVFALCPRGYGKTSFRLYEALQLGCIPVYIYDEPWLPYGESLDWREICILVPLAAADRLHEILSAVSDEQIAAMQRRIAELFPRYFTLPAVVEQTLGRLQQEKPVPKRRAA